MHNISFKHPNSLILIEKFTKVGEFVVRQETNKFNLMFMLILKMFSLFNCNPCIHRNNLISFAHQWVDIHFFNFSGKP